MWSLFNRQYKERKIDIIMETCEPDYTYDNFTQIEIMHILDYLLSTVFEIYFRDYDIFIYNTEYKIFISENGFEEENLELFFDGVMQNYLTAE